MQTDHLVAFSPVEALTDDGQTLRGILDERDVPRVLGVDQACQAFPQAPLDLQPGRVITRPAGHILLREVRNGLCGTPWPWADGCMIQVAQASFLWKFGGQVEHRMSWL